MRKPSFVFTHSSVCDTLTLRNLWFWKQEGKLPPSPASAYKWNIYIFQAWYRELLLKDEWDDDMRIFDLNWSQYDHFCCKYQKDKVATMLAPAVPVGYKQPMDPITRWDKVIR
jgi:hypothetical protein